MMQPYEQLELEFGRWVGDGRHYVACSSGTAALHLALESLGLPRGTASVHVAVPEYTMVACARAVTLAGLKPRFVDCGEDLLLDPSALDRLPQDVWAVMPVHVYGRRCDMDRIAAFTDRRGLAVVEDLAEAHGVKPHPRTDAACWSFFRNKIVYGEEGGMVAFRNAASAEAARSLRNMGHPPAHDFLHRPRAHNYRLANLLALPILESLRSYEENAKRRRQVERWYDGLVPREWQMPPRDAVWVYDVRVPGMTEPEQLRVVRELDQRGVAARCGFKPMSRQPEYRDEGYRSLNAHRLSAEVFYLPVVPEMRREDVLYNAGELRKTLSGL